MLRLAPLLAVALLALPAAAHAQDLLPDALPEPSVALAAPVDGADVGAGVPMSLEAVPGVGVGVVAIQVDGLPKCILTRAPYRCAWTPTPRDIGEHTIAALALGAANEVLRTATAKVTVGRLLPTGVTAATDRSRRGRRGVRLKTAGAVQVPDGLSAAACAGTVTVTVLRGSSTVVDRTAAVGPDCRYASSVSFTAPRRAASLRVRVVYGGSALLAPRSAPAQRVRLK